MSRRAPRADAWSALLLVAFITGMVLRVWQLDIQILIDDEWHAIHKLLRSTPLDIVTHLGYADYSIPLTLYFQQLQRTIGLSEWGMHVPPLIAGVGLLLVGPRLLAGSFAILVFRSWWVERRSRDALVYVAAALFAGWLHAITLPFTLLPFVYCGARALYSRDTQRLVALVKLGSATALALAVVLA